MHRLLGLDCRTSCGEDSAGKHQHGTFLRMYKFYPRNVKDFANTVLESFELMVVLLRAAVP